MRAHVAPWETFWNILRPELCASLKKLLEASRPLQSWRYDYLTRVWPGTELYFGTLKPVLGGNANRLAATVLEQLSNLCGLFAVSFGVNINGHLLPMGIY